MGSSAHRATEDALFRQTVITMRLDSDLETAAAMIARLAAEIRRLRAGRKAASAAKVSLADAYAVEARLLHDAGLSLAQIALRQNCDRSTARRRLRRPLKL